MSSSSWSLLALFLGVLLVAAWPLGIWLARLSAGQLPGWMHRLEAPLYRLAGTSTEKSMHWTQYALALLVFNALGALALYTLQRVQGGLPLNPAGMTAIAPDSAFNTAVSFVTNTNWQGYGGESSMSYLTQMLALAVQNFLSAATGIAVVFALFRGFAARASGVIGNFWVDVTRITVWLLLPLSLVFAVFLVGQGVIQNFDAYKEVSTLEVSVYQQPKQGPDGQALKDSQGNPVMETLRTGAQTLAMGPVASQEAIKMIGTNGGGFFNANSAHPYENPTALSNFLQMLAIFLIPAALCFAFGREVGDLRQGWAVLAAMTVMFVMAVAVLTPAEQAGNPLMGALGVDQSASAWQSGGNMEGKETRFGINASSLFAVVTTAASCGAVNAMHDAFTPLGGMVPLVMMQLGEVVFGGV
jgi:K+-transporting ATPase ATPase A chain